MRTFIISAAITILAISSSCTATLDQHLYGGDAAILSCSVELDGIMYNYPVLKNEIIISLPPTYKGKTMNVSFTLSEGAAVSPDPSDIKDYSTPQVFTVNSANGKTKNIYSVSVSFINAMINNASVRIGSQQALEEFGSFQYTEIGSLFLYTSGDGDSISDLSALKNIEVIRSNLEIRDIAAKNIEFQSLRNAGNIDIHSPQAESVTFSALQYVSGRFRIGNDDSGELPTQHTKLKSLHLPNLQSIGRSFILFLMPALEDLDMNHIETVGEDFEITGGIFDNLMFIKNLHTIHGSLNIVGNLKSLDGFAIETIGTGLSLSLTEVTSLEPLSVLKEVPYIKLSDSPILTSFKGLENCTPTALDITGLTAVTSLDHLPLSENMEHLQLSNMPSLASVEELGTIRTIDDLYLINCPLVADLSPLSNIHNLGDLTISQLEGLKELPEFKISTIGNLAISRMSMLSDITGLSSIEEAASLQIDNLLNLPSLSGLKNLRTISDGNIMIVNNPMITNLDALGGLEEIEFEQQTDQISITMNNSLADYSAIADLLIKYWNAGGMQRVYISMNKYNPTLEQLQNGEYTLSE